MKRRFAVTLLAVAIAIVIGAPAFATAPVIGAIRSVVIADDVPATTDNIFVYPDALALNTLAEDDNVSSGAITWSYTGTGRYTLNSRSPIDLLTDDPNSPGTKEVGEVAMDDLGETGTPSDGDVRTVTFRDTALSPVGGPHTDPTPGDSSSSTVHSEVVTLFASDGSTYSQKSIMVYTESNGVDRLSGSALIRVDQLVPTQTLGWTSSLSGSGTLTDSGGLCINVPVAGSNFAQWIGPYGIIDLVQNNVFRIRMEMDSAGATLPVGTTPFWDLVIDNYDTTNASTPNKYLGYFTNWDTEGGANAIGQVAAAGGHGGIMDVWWCPPAVNTASWNDASTGMFTATMDPLNDVRVNFRVLDVSAGALDGQNDGGAVCLNRLTIDRIPISQLAVQSTPYDQTNLSASTHVVGAIFGATATAGGASSTLYTFSGGDVTVTPNTTGSMGSDAWDLEVVNIDMGDSNNNPSDPPSLLDNYPVPWNSDELLMGSLGIQAPNAQGQTTPPDGIVLQWDTPTNELLMGAGTYSTDNTAGMPKDGVNEELVSFYYSHSSTASSIVNGDRIRMRVVLLCSTTFNSGGNANNLGGVTITNERVDVIEVPAGQ